MAKQFELNADYRPAGDQPEAITGLLEGLDDGLARQTLLDHFGLANLAAFGLRRTRANRRPPLPAPYCGT